MAVKESRWWEGSGHFPRGGRRYVVTADGSGRKDGLGRKAKTGRGGPCNVAKAGENVAHSAHREVALETLCQCVLDSETSHILRTWRDVRVRGRAENKESGVELGEERLHPQCASMQNRVDFD